VTLTVAPQAAGGEGAVDYDVVRLEAIKVVADEVSWHRTVHPPPLLATGDLPPTIALGLRSRRRWWVSTAVTPRVSNPHDSVDQMFKRH
jgi:hypothetical protein